MRSRSSSTPAAPSEPAPRDHAALPRAAARARAGEPRRRRLRLGRPRRRRGEARLRAGDRARQRRGGRRGRSRERRRQRRRGRRAARRRAGRSASGRARSRSPTSRATRWSGSPSASAASSSVASGYLEPRAPGAEAPAGWRSAARRADGGRLGGLRDLGRRGWASIGSRWRPSPSASSAARSRRRTSRRSASGSSPTGTSSRARRPTSRSSTRAASPTRPCASRGRPRGGPRAARRVYVTGCGANLAGDAFADLPENVTVVRLPGRADARVRRAGRRRDRLRPRRRRPRPHPGVREGAGRLQLLVRLLRHPAGARRLPQPPGRRRPRRGAARVDQGHREVVLTGINLGCYRDRAAGFDLRASSGRSAPRRGSSACASRRSRSTTSTRS